MHRTAQHVMSLGGLSPCPFVVGSVTSWQQTLEIGRLDDEIDALLEGPAAAHSIHCAKEFGRPGSG